MFLLSVVAAQWEFGWDALVALGTLALALATGALALSTRNLAGKTAEEVEHSKRQVDAALKQVEVGQEQATTAQDALEATRTQASAAQQGLEAAREQARISQLTLDAQIRPVLVDVRRDLPGEELVFYPGRAAPTMLSPGGVQVNADEAEVLISLPLRNAGAGLAMIRGIGVRLDVAVPTPSVTIQPANVPPGERGRISFRAIPTDPSFDPLRRVILGMNAPTIEVGYSDLAGQQMTISQFNISFRQEASWNWEVRQVHLSQPGSDPYAGSAPTS